MQLPNTTDAMTIVPSVILTTKHSAKLVLGDQKTRAKAVILKIKAITSAIKNSRLINLVILEKLISPEASPCIARADVWLLVLPPVLTNMGIKITKPANEASCAFKSVLENDSTSNSTIKI